jgi:hypothetical protein
MNVHRDGNDPVHEDGTPERQNEQGEREDGLCAVADGRYAPPNLSMIVPSSSSSSSCSGSSSGEDHETTAALTRPLRQQQRRPSTDPADC